MAFKYGLELLVLIELRNTSWYLPVSEQRYVQLPQVRFLLYSSLSSRIFQTHLQMSPDGRAGPGTTSHQKPGVHVRARAELFLEDAPLWVVIFPCMC